MLWIIAGLMFSFFAAITMLINQKFQIDGHLISGMRGILVGVIFWFAVPFVSFSTNWLFWTLILFEAAISTFYNARLYESAARYGAGSTSRISVLAIAFGVVFWWIIDYKRFFALLENPFILSGILISLCVVCVGFYFMALRGSQSKPGELKYLMPAVIVSAVMLINRKEIMENADFFTAAVYYCSVSIFLSGFSNLSIYAFKSGITKLKKDFSNRKILLAGVLMAGASSITILCGNTSTLFSPNPAFVNALTLTTPIWVLAFDKFIGKNSRIAWGGTIVMLIGLLALIYFANLPLDMVQ